MESLKWKEFRRGSLVVTLSAVLLSRCQMTDDRRGSLKSKVESLKWEEVRRCCRVPDVECWSLEDWSSELGKSRYQVEREMP